MKVILGSQSPQRFNLLREIVPPEIEVQAMPTGLDEKAMSSSLSPAPRSMELAAQKMQALQKLVSPIERAILVTADTVTIASGHRLREKPESPAQARLWLRSYTMHHPLEVITSVIVANTWNRQSYSSIERATVEFLGFSEEDIAAIIADGTALQCAGAVTMEHRLFKPRIRNVKGERATIDGLPQHFVSRVLTALLT